MEDSGHGQLLKGPGGTRGLEGTPRAEMLNKGAGTWELTSAVPQRVREAHGCTQGAGRGSPHPPQ